MPQKRVNPYTGFAEAETFPMPNPQFRNQDYFPSPIRHTMEEVPELPLQQSGFEPESKPIQIHIPEESSIWEQLRDAFSNPPTLQNNKPSTGRKIAGAVIGGLTGAGYGPEEGVKTAQSITQKPYRENYQDWLTKTNALKDRANIELARDKSQIGGLSDIASFIRATNEFDPDVQSKLEGAKVTAKKKAEEPFEDTAQKRKKDLLAEESRLIGDRNAALETQRQKGRIDLNEKNVKASWDKLQATLSSKERISTLNRELKQKLEQAKLRRIPVRDQELARQLATREVANMSSSVELGELFNTIKDSVGNVVGYELKPDGQTSSQMREIHKSRKFLIDDIKKKILATSPGSVSNSSDSNDDEDRFDIEEIED